MRNFPEETNIKNSMKLPVIFSKSYYILVPFSGERNLKLLPSFQILSQKYSPEE